MTISGETCSFVSHHVPSPPFPFFLSLRLQLWHYYLTHWALWHRHPSGLYSSQASAWHRQGQLPPCCWVHVAPPLLFLVTQNGLQLQCCHNTRLWDVSCSRQVTLSPLIPLHYSVYLQISQCLLVCHVNAHNPPQLHKRNPQILTFGRLKKKKKSLTSARSFELGCQKWLEKKKITNKFLEMAKKDVKWIKSALSLIQVYNYNGKIVTEQWPSISDAWSTNMCHDSNIKHNSKWKEVWVTDTPQLLMFMKEKSSVNKTWISVNRVVPSSRAYH